MNDFPFRTIKIPVAQGSAAFRAFVEAHNGYSFCPYLADKDAAAWDISTSRVYMNQVLPKFLYVPVTISKNDMASLQELFNYVEGRSDVAAVNITQPHKSNEVVRELFMQDAAVTNVDSLIRDNNGKLLPYDLNGPSFVGWFNDEVADFAHKIVLLVGVGGLGEPVAKRIAQSGVEQLILVDPVDKQLLARQLGQYVTYYRTIANLPPLSGNLVVINAAGKEGAADPGLAALLERYAAPTSIFVDLRPQFTIPEVDHAVTLGWQGYTGNGMNARNDYELVRGIASYLHLTVPTFTHFRQLVDSAS